MAGLICNTNLNGTTGVSLSAATAKTIFTIGAPTNQRVKLRALRLYTNGTTGTDAPIHITIQWYSSGGSGSTTVTAADIGRYDDATETPQATVKYGYTSEPTMGDVVYQTGFHPQATLPESWPASGEFLIRGGNTLAITANSPSAKTIYGSIEWEE